MENRITDFKVSMRNDWDLVAAGWEKWWKVLEKGSEGVSLKLIELACLKEGDNILDIATGIGEPALRAAKRVGGSGCVTAIDLSPGMLGIARRRAKDEGADNIEFLEMDGEDIHVKKSGYDAVLCRWGLMFFQDPAKALGIINGLIRDGGRFAAAVWSEPPKVPMISLAMNVVRTELKLPPPVPGGKPTPFSLADIKRLEEKFIEAGFKGVSSEKVIVSVEFPSEDVYVEFTKDVSGPVVALMRNESEETKEKIWGALKETAKRFKSPDGTIRMENEAVCVAGYKATSKNCSFS